MNVAILGRARLEGRQRTVIALTYDGRLIRLARDRGVPFTSTCEYEPGHLWNLTLRPAPGARPFVELYHVGRGQHLGQEGSLRTYLDAGARVWQGELERAFGLLLRRAPDGLLFAARDGLPDTSLCLWRSDIDLVRHADGSAYVGVRADLPLRLPCAAEPAPAAKLPAGTPLILGLSPWRAATETLPERVEVELYGGYV